MKRPSTLTLFSTALLAFFLLASFSTQDHKFYGKGLSSSLIKSYKSGAISVYKLQDGYSEMGHAIWLNRSSKRVKAVYFSEGDVYGKFKRWKSGKNIVLTCSGAFADDLDKTNGALPVGLNVENGNIKNRNVIKDKMDALVIVYGTGGIVVSDLTKGDLFLKSLNKEVDIRKDFTAKYDLLKWAEKEQATIFQTQLLAYKNKLKIDSDGRKKRRERRFLALATNRSGVLYHIIFNFPREIYLYDGAKDVLEHLKDQGMDVTALLNLDTGAYNVLDLNTGDYDLDGKIKGKTQVSKAVNLLSYHYE